MEHRGSDVITVGSTRIGQPYVFGANVPLDNPNWRGPWDCAEFASWCAFQAYGILFGVGSARTVSRAEPFSGHWFSDAQRPGVAVSFQRALAIPGAFLIRKPRRRMIGHVAISLGDGRRTLEARSRSLGLKIFDGAAARPWDIGALLPGVDYVDDGVDGEVPVVDADDEVPPPALPDGFLDHRRPPHVGASIVALQRALEAKGIDPGPIDGEFGPMTEAAVISFQAREGLEIDGIVGPVTAGALGLGFPIVATAADTALFNQVTAPDVSPVIAPFVASAGSGASVDTVTDIALRGGVYRATTAQNFAFLVGSRVTFTDDRHRAGLFQKGRALTEIDQFGVYKASDFAGAFGKMAHFIEPTLTAEGGGKFARLNSYDRAAFTFGAPQLAAHTPGDNFILYLRALLALPGADQHFPELSLRANGSGEQTVHLKKGSTFQDLERASEVTRPNGIVETQLARLMAYLNPEPGEVDGAELQAAARLMNWLRADPKARELQIKVFVDGIKAKLAETKNRVPRFTGRDWPTALWVMDIRHQGRGTFRNINAALGSDDPEEALAEIGAARFPSRIREIKAGVAQLRQSGVLAGFTV